MALDWTDELARTSYGLHQELAMTLDADIGYRPVLSQQQQQNEAAAGGVLQSFQIGWMAACQGAR